AGSERRAHTATGLTSMSRTRLACLAGEGGAPRDARPCGRTLDCRADARGDRERTAPPSSRGGQETRLHALTGASHPHGVESLHYQRPRHGVATPDGGDRILF